MLRRFRGRFGIAAPRVAVRTRLPWRWRILGGALAIVVAAVLAAWIYDAGRRFAGFDRGATQQELDDLKERLGNLQSELDAKSRLADVGESNLQIERTARQQLTLQVRRLEQENARLKEDLAVFESLAQSDGSSHPGVSIHHLSVDADAAAAGQYKYRMLVSVQGTKRDREFEGSLQLVVTMQQGGKVDMMIFPRPNAADASNYRLIVKHFRMIEGVFRVPAEAVVKNVEVRMMQGNTMAATQSVAL